MTANERNDLLREIDKKNLELSQLINKIDHSKLNEINYLLSLDKKSFGYAINMLVSSVNKSLSVSKENVGEIRKVLLSKKPNIVSKIKRGLYLIKEYERISFSKSEPRASTYSYLLKQPAELDTPYFQLNFLVDSSNRNVHLKDYPLIIRNINDGDYTYINGYRVEVRRLFIDWKMPISLRLKWPVILNNEGKIIYVPRYQKEFKADKNSNFFVKI